MSRMSSGNVSSEARPSTVPTRSLMCDEDRSAQSVQGWNTKERSNVVRVQRWGSTGPSVTPGKEPDTTDPNFVLEGKASSGTVGGTKQPARGRPASSCSGGKMASLDVGHKRLGRAPTSCALKAPRGADATRCKVDPSESAVSGPTRIRPSSAGALLVHIPLIDPSFKNGQGGTRRPKTADTRMTQRLCASKANRDQGIDDPGRGRANVPGPQPGALADGLGTSCEARSADDGKMPASAALPSLLDVLQGDNAW